MRNAAVIEAQVSTTEITVGDPIAYRLSIPFEAGSNTPNIDLAAYITPTTDNGFYSISQESTATQNQWIYQTQFTFFNTGKYQIAQFELNGKKIAALPLTVRSVISQTSTPNLIDVKGPYKTFSLWWILIMLGIAGAIAGYRWWKKKYGNKGPIALVPADPGKSRYEIWEEFFDYFDEIDLATITDWKAFYFESSQKLKDCFHAVYTLDVRDLTTYEISDRRLDPMDDLKPALLEILQAADAVKFAKHEPTAEEASAYLKSLVNVIEALRPSQESSSENMIQND